MEEMEARIPVDSLDPTVRHLVGELNANARVDALLNSRLVERSVSKADLRRKYPDPQAWTRFVLGSMSDPRKEEEAFRALGLVVEFFIDLATVDARLKSVVRKARAAADRQDVDGLKKAVSKLSPSYEIAGRIPWPQLLVYLVSPSRRTRQKVANLIAAVPDPEVREQPDSPAGEISSPSAFGAPESLAVRTDGKEPADRDPGTNTRGGIDGLLASLRQLASGGGDSAPPWDATELLTEVQSTFPETEWPSCGGLATSISGHLKLVRGLVDNAERAEIAIESLQTVSESLVSLVAGVERLKPLIEQADSVAKEVRERAKVLVSATDLEDRAAVALAIGQLETQEQFSEGVRALAMITAKSRERRQTMALELMDLVIEISRTCALVSVEKAAELRREVFELLQRSDRPGLVAIKDGLDRTRQQVLESQGRVIAASESVLAFLAIAQGTDVNEREVTECLDAVKAGDQLRAARAAGNIVARAASAARPSDASVKGSGAREALKSTGDAAPPPALPEHTSHRTDDVPVIGIDDFAPRNVFTTEYLKRLPTSKRSAEVIRSLLREESDPAAGSLLAHELCGVTRGTDAAGEAVFMLLEWRALEELARGSVLGAVEHGLDIVELASRAKQGGELWMNRGAAVLALVPPLPAATGRWGALASKGAREVLSSEDPLLQGLERLLAGVSFAQALSERFLHKAMRKLAPSLAQKLFKLIVDETERAHLRDELAIGVAEGVKYGDDEVVRLFLIELAGGCVPPVAAKELRALLGNAASADSRTVQQLDRSVLSRAPDWLRPGLERYLQLRAALNEQSGGRTKDADKPFSLSVPKSVRDSKGFVVRDGDRAISVALILSTNAFGIFNAELLLRASLNKDWLERDLIAYVGPLQPGSQHLLQLTLPLNRDVRADDSPISMTFSLRWMESGALRPPVPQTGSISLPLTQPRQLSLDSYPGAMGTPLVLVDEKLELSSSYVRSALKDISEQLTAGNSGAFLITGRRRRGKTSILATLMRDRNILKHFVVVQDILEDVPFRTTQQALSHLGKILDVSASKMGVTMPCLADLVRHSGGWPEIQSWLGDLSAKLTRPTKLLLLVDEFQKWLSVLDADSRARVLAALRGLYNRPDGSKLLISIVLSGLSNIKSYVAASADFQNAFSKKVIGPFTQEETDRLVKSNKSIEFDARAVTALRDFSGGNPFLVNLLGNKVVDWLRQQHRPYCFRDDVDHAVRDELGSEESRGWSFIQYLLKEGEEDHAPEIRELPTLVAVARTLQQRGPSRSAVRLADILAELASARVDHDPETVRKDLESCVEDELLNKEGDRYSFASRCLREWLAARHDEPLPIRREHQTDLVLNRYRIDRPLARGGQASSVFVAKDTHLHDQLVVLKVYARDQAGGASSLVQREAKALTKVEHSAIIRVHTYGEDPKFGHVLVLEHAQGDDLRKIIRNPDPVASDLAGPNGDLKKQVDLLIAVTHALAECHRAGVIHKDIKPEHILVRPESGVWAPKIIDFGLATEVGAVGAPTVAAYSEPYVAPEKLRGEPREAPADVYSLGVVAFELLTAELPFIPGRSSSERSGRKDLRALRPSVPVRLSGLIDRMLADDPRERPSAVSVASELEVALEPQEWTEFWEAGKTAFNATNRDTRDIAVRHFQQAVSAAPARQRLTSEYLDLLEALVMSIEDGSTGDICERLEQPLLTHCVAANDVDHARRQALLRSYVELLLDSTRVASDGMTATVRVRELCRRLLSMEPSGVAVGAIELLLGAESNPTAWHQRELIHELGLHYRAAKLLKSGALESWCLSAARRLRENNAPLLDCQQWLRRAERLGVDGNKQYQDEREKLERLLARTAHEERLPKASSSQEDARKAIGDDERGHLHVDRIVAWIERLYRRHPYVHAVRRVSKDGMIAPSPSRVLDVTNIARHAKAAVGVLQERIVPAVLDQSFCVESCALRINIILDEGCTVQERQAVLDELQKDRDLFPTDG